jgi:hypothetical protein
MALSFERRCNIGDFVFGQTAGARPVFWLSVRSMAAKDIGVFRSIPPLKQAVRLQTWVPLTFCPWCGVNLERHYKKQMELLTDPELDKEKGDSK